MLVAYAIAQAEGFRPSTAFKSHPDYALVARWYEEIQPKSAASGMMQGALTQTSVGAGAQPVTA